MTHVPLPSIKPVSKTTNTNRPPVILDHQCHIQEGTLQTGWTALHCIFYNIERNYPHKCQFLPKNPYNSSLENMLIAWKNWQTSKPQRTAELPHYPCLLAGYAISRWSRLIWSLENRGGCWSQQEDVLMTSCMKIMWKCWLFPAAWHTI